ncbi:MAG: hypothetical protein PHI09_03190, partial [Candidatus Omnitrophica bacterium]|nr:hypothetical protein [Candidatus Omnitrophota bacterium]
MYTHIDKILNYVFLGNTLQRYLITICILVLGMLIIKLIVRRVVSRLKALAQKTIPIFDYFLVTLLEKVVLPLFYMLVIFLALKSLAFPEAIGRTFSYIILGVIVFFAVKTLIAFIGYGFMVYSRKQKGDPQLEKSLQGIMVIIRIAIWAGAVIFFLDNL